MTTALGYNEPAWAIDVISEANRILAGRSGAIRRAGGESSLPAPGERTLFPDVLLYGEEAGRTALQGWELKFPDTPISDSALFSNAVEKANRLKTDSYVLWNVTVARLWVRVDGDRFEMAREWLELAALTSRSDVRNDRAQWGDVLVSILDAVEGLIRDGRISAPTLAEVVGTAQTGLVSAIVASATPATAMALEEAASADRTLRHEVVSWWAGAKFEYLKQGSGDSWQVLAGLVVATWLNRFSTAHILRPAHVAVDDAIALDGTTTVTAAAAVFHSLPATTDFAPVFGPQLGEEYIAPSAWREVLGFHEVLKGTLVAAGGGTATTTGWFHHATELSRASSAGQYSTPRALADLMVALTIDNISEAIVCDPCCGTGTIARAALDMKLAAGGTREAFATTWLSDKFAFPLQAAQLQMVDPADPGALVRLFQEDVFLLEDGQEVLIADPSDGSFQAHALPRFDALVTNAPFVAANTYRSANPNVDRAADLLESFDVELAGRSDLYAYVAAKAWSLLRDGGRLGILTSNSWLASEWGVSFREMLTRLFDLELVVCSMKGPWFASADVVATLVVASRRPAAAVRAGQSSQPTRFVALTHDLATVSEVGADVVAAEASGSGRRPVYTVAEDQTPESLRAVAAFGFGWVAAFADMAWVSDVMPLTMPLADILDMGRGERRGWNKLFYPDPALHRIEGAYLQPLLKSSAALTHLTGTAPGEVFACNVSTEELQRRGHSGALEWIRRFESLTNTKGEPLPEVLARGHAGYWYEFDASTRSDFVTSLNPETRLFVARLDPPACVDQRLVRMSVRRGVKPDLLHALLNSTLGMLALEASGFGRGLGALDLAATHLKTRTRVLNPDLFDAAAIVHIQEAFAPLLARAVASVNEELSALDRHDLDTAILAPLGLLDHLPSIRAALERLYSIRQAVHDR